MKKITKDIFKKLPPLDLYPDDIKEIYNLLKEDCDHIEIEVKAKNGTYMLEDVAEIKDIKTSHGYVTELSITGEFKSQRPSRIQIFFLKSLTYVSGIMLTATAAEDSAKIGLLSNIEETLLKRKSNLRMWLYAQPFKNAFFISFIIILLLGLLNKIEYPSYTLLLFVIGYFFSLWLPAHTYIFTSEHPTLLARQKDNIIAGIIYSIIAGIIVGVILKFF